MDIQPKTLLPLENHYAFPIKENADRTHLGLTIRQWYAGQALASGMYPHNNNLHEYNKIADWCLGVADAMIKASKGET